MSLFRSMMSVNFMVGEEGETTFFFPVFGGAWCARRGYRSVSDEDVEKLKRYLRIYFGILIFGLAPLAAVVAVMLADATGIVFLAYLLCCVGVGIVYTLVFERVFIRGVVDNYEQGAEKVRFGELQRRQAESYSWNALILLVVANAMLLAVGLFVVLSGIAAGTGIVVVAVFSLTGAQLVQQMKRRGRNASDSC